MVIALDRHKKPLGFVTEKRARKLMDARRACVHRYFPFTVIIKDVDARNLDGVPTFRVKIDPGSAHTGVAIVGSEDNAVYFFMQIEHRGQLIREGMVARAAARRNRRERETWYRRPKWGNKPKAKDGHAPYDSARPEGWLPPSVRSVGDNIISWVDKLRRLIPVTECSFEAVRFDTQLMDNPNVEGEQYQHGTLFGYELREYLLDKYNHVCQYCGGESGDSVLEWEHVKPRSRGGSDSVKNATLSCRACNIEKGAQTPEEWLNAIKAKPRKTKLDGARIKRIGRVIEGKENGTSDRYCAWVNSTRRYVEKALFNRFGDVECGSGGRTKHNRTMLGLPKDHHYDALCVGTVPDGGYADRTGGHCLYVKAMGHGNRLLGHLNKCGVITEKFHAPKRVMGFQTGDMVRAIIPQGARSKYVGTYTGRVNIRSSGYFDVKALGGGHATVRAEFCRLLQHADGYQYCLS